MVKRWLPYPPLLLALVVMRLLLNQPLDVGTLLLAAVLAVANPLLTRSLRPAPWKIGCATHWPCWP